MAINMIVLDEAEIKKEVQEQVKPVPEELAQLQAQAERNAEEIIDMDIDELVESIDIKSIEHLGKDSMKRSAAQNYLLEM